MNTNLTRTTRRALLTALLLAAPATARAEDDGAHDLIQRLLDARPKMSFFARMKLSSSRGWVRELSTSRKRLDNVDASFMEVTAPHDVAGTRFLLLDSMTGHDQQFVFVPAAHRVMEVTGDTKKQPFLGSDFYISDLAAPDPDAYAYKFSGEEAVDGRHCKLVESTPKATTTNEPYSKTILAIDPTDLLVVRTQFYDLSGKLIKVWTVDKLEKVDGIWTPLHQRMKALQDNSESEMELFEVKYNVELPDELFTRGHLLR